VIANQGTTVVRLAARRRGLTFRSSTVWASPVLTRLRVLAILLVLCGGGCPATSDTPGTSSPAVVDAFIGQLAEAMCGWQFRCCALPEIDGARPGIYLTEDGCRPVVARLLSDKLSEVRIAFEADQLSFDATVASACLAQFTHGACNPPLDLLRGGQLFPQFEWDRYATCPNPFIGKLPTGSACSLPIECQPGQSCAIGGDAISTVTAGGVRAGFQMSDSASGPRGHCVPDGQAGTPCSITNECAPGLYCRVSDLVCAQPSQEGEACQISVDSNQMTSVAIACADRPRTLLCAGGHCHRMPQSGDPCLTTNDSPVPCDPDVVPSLTCVGAGLNGAGVCMPSARSGDPCVMLGGIAPCADGQACIGDSGTASTSASSASPQLGYCGSAPPAGAPCSLDLRCAAPAVCYQDNNANDVCVSPGKVRGGGNCQSDLDCASLSCTPDPTQNGGKTCTPPQVGLLCAGAQNFVAQGSSEQGQGQEIGGPAVDAGVPAKAGFP